MEPSNRRTGLLVGGGILVLLCSLAILAPVACPSGPFGRYGLPLEAPGTGLLLGTDNLGRSIGCMSAYGLRASLMVGFGVMAMALGVGMALGLCAGYFGGAADAMLTRTIAAFQVVPRLFLAIFVGALFGPSLSAIALVLGLTSWPLVARLVRAETMALRSRGFVLASHALGCSHGRVILRHILPNAVFQAAATTSTLVGSAVLAEAALGFIGLSDGRTVSLGRLIAEAYPFFALAPWMSFVPVSMLVLLVLSAQAVVGSVMSGAGSDWRISATST